MLARQHQGADVRARPQRIPEGLRSVAMHETLYVEAIRPSIRAIRNRAITISHIGVTKRHSFGHLQGQLFFASVI